jgi:glycosyltransferase involved in cell wall biosynthesis
MDVEPFLHAAAGEDRASMRDALGLAESDFVIGTIARLAQHKGHDDLLDALASDLRANPNWKLLWIGDGWWRERLLAKARSLGITTVQVDRQSSADHRLTVSPSHTAPSDASPSQLILTGLVPPARIPSLLRAMDALAHPSYREGLPRTVPQALLAGVVPIAYDCDGTGEVCVDMQTGRLVPSGDIAALREAVWWVAAHPRERAELAQRGHDACVRDFSTRAMVEGLERVYARHVGH